MHVSIHIVDDGRTVAAEAHIHRPFVLSSGACHGFGLYIIRRGYQNKNLPIAERVGDLLGRMTLEPV